MENRKKWNLPLTSVLPVIVICLIGSVAQVAAQESPFSNVQDSVPIRAFKSETTTAVDNNLIIGFESGYYVSPGGFSSFN